MRLFIAVPLSAEARTAAAATTAVLRASAANFKWVEPANLHLTLSFLGEMKPEAVPAAEAAMRLAAAGRQAFEITLDRPDAFPALEHPEIVWLGASMGEPELADLAAALAAELERAGLRPPREKDRPFAAHLTLGRRRGSKNLARLKSMLAGLKADVRTRADRLVLYQSRISAAGPNYHELAQARLL